MWEQSLIIRCFLTVLVAGGGSSGLAASYCSNSFRFDQLCPDPRFGSREVGGGGVNGVSSTSHLSTDTYIQLKSDNVNHRNRGGYSPTSGYGGRSFTSSMSVKDPTTTSCEFHRNGDETAVVSAIHVTEYPFNFRHANQCNHIIKLNYDLFDEVSGGGYGGGSVGSGSVGGVTPSAAPSFCQNERGFRRQGSQDIDHNSKHGTKVKQVVEPQSHRRQQDHDEDTAKKMNVYFWHNFTIFPHSAEFVDTITNHHWSREDVACVNEKRIAQYVQIVVIISKSGRCEVIVQQYKISEKRSPWGCTGAVYPIPYPIQFCGSYDCSQSTSILTGLKLHPKRDSNNENTPSWNQQGGGGGRDSIPLNEINGEGTHTYPDYEDGGLVSAAKPPCTTEIIDTMTNPPPPAPPGAGKGPHTQIHIASSDPSEEEEEKVQPMDWMEALFLFAFPTGGILFIVIVLNILRTQSAREICRGYSYPRPRQYHNNGVPIGSFTSIDKNGLPI